MTTVVRFGTDEATVDRGQWTCSEKPLEDLLNIMRPACWTHDLDYDLTLAEDAIKQIGGEIIRHEKPVHHHDPNIIY